MAATDQRVRSKLVQEGTLFDGYHPHMAKIQRQNAGRLTIAGARRYALPR